MKLRVFSSGALLAIILSVAVLTQPVLQETHAIESQLEACRPMDQTEKEALFDYLEIFRTYSFPAAWGNPPSGDSPSGSSKDSEPAPLHPELIGI